MLVRRFLTLHHGLRLNPIRAARCPSPPPVVVRHRSSHTPRDGDDGPVYPDSSTRLHSDLDSFLSYADKTGLDKASTVYKGTLYEYTVGKSLARYGFELRRVGGASDAGIDLIGTWTLPANAPPHDASASASASASPQSSELASSAEADDGESPSDGDGDGGDVEDAAGAALRTLRVLVQCKFEARKPGPRHVRELEGSFAGAPAGWTGNGVIGFVVCRMPATRSMQEALGRSGRAMGYLTCGEGGEVLQMLWNGRAEEEGLAGLGVGVKRYEDGRKGELVLTMHGAPVPLVEG